MSYLRWIRWLGLVQLAFVVLLGAISPRQLAQLPADMRTPVLAFELAREAAEIDAMFGPPSARRNAWVSDMRVATFVDYGFLLAYGAFLACSARALAATSPRRRSLQAAFLLAWLAPLADAIENASLLSILDALDGSYPLALSVLSFSTWIKWFALAGCAACMSPALLRQSSIAARAAAICGILTLPLTVAALAMRGVFAEAMFAGDALCTIGIWIWSTRA